ncbi:ABC transporter ATP-binding protein [Jeotgalibaca sp. A127]|uniref:ABC transporter ATP-binding protein n=1 Tax=Jeotgalibaca sp. A127 TaxID=3457324 RepID=UPI003FCFA99E
MLDLQIQNLHLKIKAGEMVTLLGPSGCGKTTLLRKIGGFIPATEGEVMVQGKDITQLLPEVRPTAMVFPSDNLWLHMTVFQNLSFGLTLRKHNRKQIQREVAAMLAIVNMSLTDELHPHQLTTEQQQRVAIARALLLKPKVLLLDEPFSNLDEDTRAHMYEELIRIQSELKTTIILATNDRTEALSLSQRIVVMEEGRVVQVGTPLEIYDHPKNSYVATFSGEMNTFEEIAFRPEDVRIFDSSKGDYVGIVDSIMLFGHYATIRILSGKYVIKAYAPKNSASVFNEKQTITFNIEKFINYEKGVGL